MENKNYTTEISQQFWYPNHIMGFAWIPNNRGTQDALSSPGSRPERCRHLGVIGTVTVPQTGGQIPNMLKR